MLPEVSHRGSSRQAAVNLVPTLDEELLCGFRCQAEIVNQPADGDRCAAASPGFAVAINTPSGVRMSLDEIDSPPDRVQIGRGEVRRRKMELLDAQALVVLLPPVVS